MSTGSSNKRLLRVVNIFGPTGVGKTALIADLFGGLGEVVCADSLQVYRYLNIGTAKPDATLLRTIPHHLIDIRNPDEQYTTGDFVRDASECVIKIGERGKLPIVSGGTAFYFKNLICGPPAAPPADPVIRNLIQEELREKGAALLYEELKSSDPRAAENIHPGDAYRITRALEVIRGTGLPLSSFPRNSSTPNRFKFLSVGIIRERPELYARIETRVNGMFRAGLVDEVRSILEMGYGFDCPGMRGIGYGEFALLSARPCSLLHDVREAIITHTRQYVKRQLAFFRSLPDVVWIHPDDRTGIRNLVDEFLAAV